MVDRENRLTEVSAKIEYQLRLVGSSAIEDKLQDQVQETIRALRQTGIILWVLTGDKIETAINIGFSAGLLESTMQIFTCEFHWESEIEEFLSNLAQELSLNKAKSALVIAGDSLTKIERQQKLTDLLVQVTDQINIVIACRVSPSQKGDIVELVKKRHPGETCLAIGDGANDVAMILKADVGVGIAGREGM